MAQEVNPFIPNSAARMHLGSALYQKSFSMPPPALHSQKAKKSDSSADLSPEGSTYPVLQGLDEA